MPEERGRPSEFEVQAHLYSELKNRGYSVRGEVKFVNKATRENCRFDLVLYEKGSAVEIIEIKWGEIVHKNGVEATRQCKRYRKFGIPVVFVYGMADAELYLEGKP